MARDGNTSVTTPSTPGRRSCVPAEDNTFFYFAYQGFRFSQPESANILVPTETQLGGDFSGICASGFTGGICNDRVTDSKGVVHVTNQLYDPFTTTPAGGGFPRQPFANNII